MATQALIDSLLEPFASAILGGVGYFGSVYLEKFSEVGLYETVGLAVCLSLAAVLLLNLPQILHRAISYKFYVPIVIFVVVLLFRLTWNRFSPHDNTTQKDNTDSTVEVQADPQKLVFTELENTQPVDLLNPQQGSKQSLSESLHAARSDGHESSSIKFDNDCKKHSQRLLSEASLTSPTKYSIQGQVEVFGRTVHLTGESSVPMIADDYKPLEFKASAMDILNRQHNTGATSKLNVQDAVEKALIEMCKNLREGG